MRIVELRVQDLKRIVAIDIVPKGNVVEIAGKNGNGKTSTLDAIWWLFTGKENITGEPVRDGAERAIIEADIGDYIIRRTINKDRGGTISVSNKDGMRAAAPQKILDELVGEMSFDPLAFMKKSPKDQLEMLKAFAPDVDFAALDKAETEAFNLRRDLNRDVKNFETLVEAAKDAGDAPEEADVDSILGRLEAARERNSRIRAAATKRAGEDAEYERLTGELRGIQETILDLKARLRRAEEQQAEAADLREKAEAVISARKVKTLPDFEDEAGIADELKEANAANAARAGAHAKANQLKLDRERLAKARQDQAAADAEVERIRNERTDALKSMKLPIKGLDVVGDGITLNGHPLNQASDAEQLRVGVALAMKANPKLKVVRIRDGSLLDDDSWKLLSDMAADEDFQVWIETVGAGHGDAIIIEAGEVKGAPKKTVKQASDEALDTPAEQAKTAAASKKNVAAAKAKPKQDDLDFE